MAATGEVLVCGCPFADPHICHLPGCWLGEAEAVAAEAATSAHAYEPPRHRTVAALTALAEAGYLREVTDPDVLFGVLDELVGVGLLGPSTVEPS